jgi:hypothetical protein
MPNKEIDLTEISVGIQVFLMVVLMLVGGTFILAPVFYLCNIKLGVSIAIGALMSFGGCLWSLGRKALNAL